MILSNESEDDSFKSDLNSSYCSDVSQIDLSGTSKKRLMDNLFGFETKENFKEKIDSEEEKDVKKSHLSKNYLSNDLSFSKINSSNLIEINSFIKSELDFSSFSFLQNTNKQRNKKLPVTNFSVSSLEIDFQEEGNKLENKIEDGKNTILPLSNYLSNEKQKRKENFLLKSDLVIMNKTKDTIKSIPISKNQISFQNLNLESQELNQNISNTTEDLFSSLNKKMDNFELTNSNILNNSNHPEYSTHYKLNNNNQFKKTFVNNNNPIILNNNFPNYNNIIYGENSKYNCKQNYGIFFDKINYTELSDEELSKISNILARDQTGCRFIQKRIIDQPQFANEILFTKIESHLLELIVDVYGNYLIQKLIENIDVNKIEKIIEIISSSFLEISKSPHGTRVIQKLIQNLRTEKLLNKFDEVFVEYLIEISKDINANHILIKYIKNIKFPHNKFVYDILINNLEEIACDKHGCCVLQKLIEEADEINQKVKLNFFLFLAFSN